MSVPASDPGALEPPAVPPEAYSEEYYLTISGGHSEWVASNGATTGGIYALALDKIGDMSGKVLIDIGTGRGELLSAALERGALHAYGVEYSESAVELARTSVHANSADTTATVLVADARRIPLPDATADIVTMLDVVEHLTPTELSASLAEARRLLRPGGLIAAHTYPTSTLYRVYGIQRHLVPGRARRWPRDPRVPYERLMHVNEQSLRSLRTSFRAAGFVNLSVRPAGTVYTGHIPDQRARRIYGRLAKVPPLARFVVSNIWVQGNARL